jgi:hypothetical protein
MNSFISILYENSLQCSAMSEFYWPNDSWSLVTRIKSINCVVTNGITLEIAEGSELITRIKANISHEF